MPLCMFDKTNDFLKDKMVSFTVDFFLNRSENRHGLANCPYSSIFFFLCRTKRKTQAFNENRALVLANIFYISAFQLAELINSH